MLLGSMAEEVRQLAYSLEHPSGPLLEKYSQHPVTRTLRRMNNLFEIANVRVIERILYGRGFQGKNKFSRIIECSSYRAVELPDVDCIDVYEV